MGGTTPHGQANEHAPDWAARFKLHNTLPRTVPGATLGLLVAVSTQLSESEYHILLPSLWNQHIEDDTKRIAAPVRTIVPKGLALN